MAEVSMIGVRSSSVARVGHDHQRNELHVEFVGGDRYIYSLVPARTFRALLDATSVGVFVNTVIKPQHPVRRA